MIRSRLLRLSSSIPLRNRFPHHGPYRSYIKGSHHRDRKLVKQFIGGDEPLQSWPWAYYVVPPAAVLAIAGIGLLIKNNDEKRAIPKGSHQDAGSELKINKPAIGGPFELYDMENRVVTDRDFCGNWILMYFGYTSSPDVGPEEVQKMAKATNILEFDSRIIGLTGPIAAVRQMAQEFRVYFKKVDEEGQDYLVESSHNMYLLDPNMEIVKIFGVEYDASELADEIIREVKKASK